MNWRCEGCGEEHSDQFDGCWRCTATHDDSMRLTDNPSNRGCRFSIRSMILLTFSFATICGIVANNPHNSMIVVLAMYVIAWLAPSASIGFDYNQSIHGVKNGLIRGAICCGISIFVISLFLPTDQ